MSRSARAGLSTALRPFSPEVAHIALAPFTGAASAADTIEHLAASGVRL